MTRFDDPAFFGDQWAGVYDDHYAWIDHTFAVGFLAEATAGGRALELAVGTGRVAVPLAARGVDVHGVEASEAMVARLRKKPGGKAIPVVVGDMATTPLGGPFEVIYLVFNGLFSLLTQERQIQCFRNVFNSLAPTGVFIIECFVPDLAHFTHGQRTVVRAVQEKSAAFEITLHDASTQRFTTQMVMLDGDGMHLYPVALRYCWPSELDLMARMAGLRLCARYGGWDRRPYDSSSTGHVSVYERVG